jgi:hypothetical protein
VIGRDFSYALLSSVAGLEDAPLQTVVGTARRGRHFVNERVLET